MPPGSHSEDSSATGREFSSGGQRPGSAKGAQADPDAKQEKIADLVATVEKELDLTQAKDLEWRRHHFKGLLLKWHPDKNMSQSAEAAEVFKHLMARRGQYLES